MATTCMPQIAVIVSCYNYEAFITECLQSILNQNYPYCHIILVDDGSEDNSVQTIQNFCQSQQTKNITLITQSNNGQLGSFMQDCKR
ncbi:glycosyltransferase [Helicobacter mastomyrinus]|uniref:Glycosyltransferase n=1 Tax=Helicobacter mastomyrinus TaxID=287948 RepID=A0ABZ3F695_9HELI|nr:glycosyltransferase [uncultured Helicobacter sp.]